jgi:DNA-binding LacI/PurR family transcriptional regulator
VSVRPSTITDVADAAGVSRQTVSNVLNSPEIVRAATRERVERVIAELGYRPHASARRLRTRRSSTLAVRLDRSSADGVSGAVLDRFLHALTEQADAQGLRVLLYTARDADDEIRQFRRLVEGSDVDAFVLAGTYFGDPRTDWLIDQDQAFVTFGRPWGIADLEDPRHFWVDVDGRAGVREATEHLLAEGSRAVGFIGWPAGSGTGDDRRAGWEAALGASRVPARRRAALQVAAVESVAAGRDAMLALLAQAPEVDAVVAVSDTLALGALIATDGRMPVIGFDNTPVASSIGFSSVDQRLDEVAAAALELIGAVGATHSAHTDAHRLVVPRLVVREHSAALDLLQ